MVTHFNSPARDKLKTKEHFQFILQDSDLNEESGKFRLGTEIKFTRTQD
jgi:hypothetical protein